MKLNRNPFLCGVLACIIFLAGCSAHRIQTDPAKPPQAVTAQEQLNSANAQLAIHNRAAAKTIVAAYQQGFMEKAYFDSLSREQIAITRAHAKLSKLLVDLPTATNHAAEIQAIIASIRGSAGEIAKAAGVKNPQSQGLIQADASLIASSVTSIISILQTAGVKGF